jgi:hypothetical protein
VRVMAAITEPSREGGLFGKAEPEP